MCCQRSGNLLLPTACVLCARVTEDVPLDAGSTQLGRRDLRFGRQSTAAKSVPGGVLVEMSWGPPLAGEVDGRAQVGGQHVDARLGRIPLAAAVGNRQPPTGTA